MRIKKQPTAEHFKAPKAKKIPEWLQKSIEKTHYKHICKRCGAEFYTKKSYKVYCTRSCQRAPAVRKYGRRFKPLPERYLKCKKYMDFGTAVHKAVEKAAGLKKATKGGDN